MREELQEAAACSPVSTSLQYTAISSEQALLSLGRRRTSRDWMMLSLSSSLRQPSVSFSKLSRRHWCTRPSPAPPKSLYPSVISECFRLKVPAAS